MASILDPELMRELQVLRRRLEIRARSAGPGDHLAKRRGGAAEFLEHRPYAAGDDVRLMDWAAYARSDEPVIRVFRSEEDVIARLLVDRSASLGVGSPPKIEFAIKLAAAVGFLALAASERAQLITSSDGRATIQAPVRGRGGLATLLAGLEAVSAHGGSDLSSSLQTLIRTGGRPGMLVVISDFFDDSAVLQALSRASFAGHDVILVQVLAPEEIEPDYEGDWALEDAETGQVLDLTMDAAAIEQYQARFERLCADLRGWAKRHRASYVRTRTDEKLEAAIRRLVRREID